mmetsp:Transcript_32780/g.47327  ORF Transcript_32780/g.47327 Transcript_32780/m.47327 type:complete len:274 (+) Transcript_32780:1259-2080(+)
MNFLIEFMANAADVNRAYINGQSYEPDAATLSRGNTSLLFSYLLPDSFPPSEIKARYHYDDQLKLNFSLGDGTHPFVIPFNEPVIMFVNNTDLGEHSLHFHGHNYWVVATSDYPQAEELYKPNYLKRDSVTVPPQGWVKLIFVSDNPGVWLLHCHIDWHVPAGMSSVVLVAPELLRSGLSTGLIRPIPPSQLAACKAPPAVAYNSSDSHFSGLAMKPSFRPTDNIRSSRKPKHSVKPSKMPIAPTRKPNNKHLMKPSRKPTGKPVTAKPHRKG